MKLPQGTVVGGYEIIEPLGQGGQSQVFKALDLSLRRTVALKVLATASALDEMARRRFLLEARALSALNHPSIATVFQIGEHEGIPFIAMELVEGQTLWAHLEADDLPVDEKLRLMLQVVDAVGYAHSMGVLHRDLKPGNILLTPDRRAKLVDFGLAKLTSAALKERVSMAGELTDAGVIVGTVSYLSPEQARGEELDGRSDLFSLGVVLYELLTGRLPFEGDSPIATLIAILKEPPREILPQQQVPPALALIVARLLEKEPARRHASAEELLDDLEAACARLGVPLSSPSPRRSSRATGGPARGLHPISGDVTAAVSGRGLLRGPTSWPRVAAVVGAAGVLAVALTMWLAVPRGKNPVPGDGVLVLPLTPSGDPDTRNLAGVVGGQMVDFLTRAPGLRVLAPSDAQARSPNGANGLAALARVRYVVDGNLFLAGAELAITVRVTERSRGRVLWSETVRGGLDEVFAMAARQASGVAGAVGVFMAPAGVAFPGEEAFDDFARGSLALASYDPAQLPDAVARLERCVTAAPGFTPAYPRLVRALLQYRNLGLDYSPVYLDRAKHWIDEGLRRDASSGELRASLGWLGMYTYNFKAAHDVASKLGRQGGGTASGCKLVVWDSFVRGDPVAAIAAAGECRAGFPLDVSIPLNLVVLNAMTGNRAAAIAAAREVEETHGSGLVNALARSWLALARGDPAQGAELTRLAFSTSGEPMLALQSAQASLAGGQYRAADEGLGVWLSRNPYSIEGQWLRCLARDLAGDPAGSRLAAGEASRAVTELGRHYKTATSELALAYFTVRAGGQVARAEVAAVDVRDEATLPAWLQQVTLARLGDRAALARPVTPYSPTFWLNRLASLESPAPVTGGR